MVHTGDPQILGFLEPYRHFLFPKYIMKEKMLEGHKSTVFLIPKHVGKDRLEY